MKLSTYSTLYNVWSAIIIATVREIAIIIIKDIRPAEWVLLKLKHLDQQQKRTRAHHSIGLHF